MASINANIWLAGVLLASPLAVSSPALEQNDAPSNPTYPQLVANNDNLAHQLEMEKLIVALSGDGRPRMPIKGIARHLQDAASVHGRVIGSVQHVCR
jgi:hypothetical protein